MEFSSASLYTATVLIPIFLAVFMTRQAISPLLAMTTFLIALGPKEETHPKSDQLTNIRNVTEGGREEFEKPITPSPLGKNFFFKSMTQKSYNSGLPKYKHQFGRINPYENFWLTRA